MAGFETVVRPSVLPNIRPAPARSVPIADDADTGFCIIRGNGAKSISLSYSYSQSASTSQPTEEKREVDTMRVYQKSNDGDINRDNYVDVNRARKLWMK